MAAARNAPALILAAPQLPLSRFDAPPAPAGGAPLLAVLDLKFDTTYGYLVMQPRAYVEYREAMERNPKLRDGLNGSRYLNPRTSQLEANPTAMPRVYFPRMASDAASEQDSRKALETLGPDAGSVVLGPHAPYRQDLFATPFVASLDEQPCHIHYAASTPSLLRLSMSWFPGWRARVDSRELPVLRVDHAMMGVVAPAGEHDLKFRFLELARLGADDFGAGHAVSFADVARRLRWAGESLRHSGPRTSPDYNRMKHPSCGILKRPSRNPESE